jgi:5-methylcytosine-specific restriction endonuclease McrA
METRICSQCKEEKNLTSDFFNYKDKANKKFRTDCKVCQNAKQNGCYKKKADYYKKVNKEYRSVLKEQNQKLLWDFLLKNPCVNCGETNPVVLELDHLRDKKYNIGDIIFCHTWESVQEEIEKCQVLCSNCHKKKTAKDFKHYKYIVDIEKFLQ